MPIEIRTVPPADQRRWYDAINVAFGEDVPDGQWELEQKMFEPDRALGVYDGDLVVGGGSAFSFSMTVPGGRKAAVGGVTMVGVMPTHRRQGALRALMAKQLSDIRDRGEPIAALWASEGSIYQRFGYGLAMVNGSFDLERDRATFRIPVEPAGHVELRDAEMMIVHVVTLKVEEEAPAADAAAAAAPGAAAEPEVIKKGKTEKEEEK